MGAPGWSPGSRVGVDISDLETGWPPGRSCPGGLWGWVTGPWPGWCAAGRVRPCGWMGSGPSRDRSHLSFRGWGVGCGKLESPLPVDPAGTCCAPRSLRSLWCLRPPGWIDRSAPFSPPSGCRGRRCGHTGHTDHSDQYVQTDHSGHTCSRRQRRSRFALTAWSQQPATAAAALRRK